MSKKLIACAAGFAVLFIAGCSKKEAATEKATQLNTQKRPLAIGPPTSYGCFSIINVASGKILEGIHTYICKRPMNAAFYILNLKAHVYEMHRVHVEIAEKQKLYTFY